MFFDYYQTDRLIVCMDPSDLYLMQDFCSDRATTRLLEIECEFSDDNVIAHAKRVGLAGEQTPAEALARLLPTIRNDMTFESDRIRGQNFEHHHRMREGDPVEVNAQKLSQFLAIPHDKAHEIAATDFLFAD
jgi:hypothetical protein